MSACCVRFIQIVDEAENPDVHVEADRSLVGCATCGFVATVKDRYLALFVDLTVVGRQIALIWNKRRLQSNEIDCPASAWADVDERIGVPRLKMTDRGGRWATFEVDQNGRTANEVAHRPGFDWHTVDDAVLASGAALVEDREQFGDLTPMDSTGTSW